MFKSWAHLVKWWVNWEICFSWLLSSSPVSHKDICFLLPSHKCSWSQVELHHRTSYTAGYLAEQKGIHEGSPHPGLLRKLSRIPMKPGDAKATQLSSHQAFWSFEYSSFHSSWFHQLLGTCHSPCKSIQLFAPEINPVWLWRKSILQKKSCHYLYFEVSPFLLLESQVKGDNEHRIA